MADIVDAELQVVGNHDQQSLHRYGGNYIT